MFRAGRDRIGEAKAAVGDPVAPGAPLAAISSTRRGVVTVALDADRQELARVGDRVTVDLPSGRTRQRPDLGVGKVATKAQEDATRRST